MFKPKNIPQFNRSKKYYCYSLQHKQRSFHTRTKIAFLQIVTIFRHRQLLDLISIYYQLYESLLLNFHIEFLVQNVLFKYQGVGQGFFGLGLFNHYLCRVCSSQIEIRLLSQPECECSFHNFNKTLKCSKTKLLHACDCGKLSQFRRTHRPCGIFTKCSTRWQWLW